MKGNKRVNKKKVQNENRYRRKKRTDTRETKEQIKGKQRKEQMKGKQKYRQEGN